MVTKIGLTTDVNYPCFDDTPTSSLQDFVVPRIFVHDSKINIF